MSWNFTLGEIFSKIEENQREVNAHQKLKKSFRNERRVGRVKEEEDEFRKKIKLLKKRN